MVTMRGGGIGEKTLVYTPLVFRWNIKERMEKRKRRNRKNGKRLMRNKLILNRRTEIITKN